MELQVVQEISKILIQTVLIYIYFFFNPCYNELREYINHKLKETLCPKNMIVSQPWQQITKLTNSIQHSDLYIEAWDQR